MRMEDFRTFEDCLKFVQESKQPYASSLVLSRMYRMLKRSPSREGRVCCAELEIIAEALNSTEDSLAIQQWWPQFFITPLSSEFTSDPVFMRDAHPLLWDETEYFYCIDIRCNQRLKAPKRVPLYRTKDLALYAARQFAEYYRTYAQHYTDKVCRRQSAQN